MIEKLRSETTKQVETNKFNAERSNEIDEVYDVISGIDESDFMHNALKIITSKIKQLEQSSDNDIRIAEQQTAELKQEIADNIHKTDSLLIAANEMESSFAVVDKSELIENANEQRSQLEELDNELSGESLNKCVDSAIKSAINNSVRTDHLPGKSNGEWVSGTKGNGEYVLNDDAVITAKQGSVITGKQLKEKYGPEGVVYKNNDPDFSRFAVNNDTVTTVPVDKMPTERKDSYKLAEQYCAEQFGLTRSEVRSYMKSNNLTWHETPDRKSIMAIPTEINAAYKHTGGISKQQSFNKLAKYINEISEGKPCTLKRTSSCYRVNGIKDVNSSLKKIIGR